MTSRKSETLKYTILLLSVGKKGLSGKIDIIQIELHAGSVTFNELEILDENTYSAEIVGKRTDNELSV